MNSSNIKLTLNAKKHQLLIDNYSPNSPNLELYKTLDRHKAEFIHFSLLLIKTTANIADIIIEINKEKFFIYKYMNCFKYINGYYMLDTSNIDFFKISFDSQTHYKYCLEFNIKNIDNIDFYLFMYGYSNIDYQNSDFLQF